MRKSKSRLSLIQRIYARVPDANKGVTYEGEYRVFYRSRRGTRVMATIERLDDAKLLKLCRKLRKKGLLKLTHC